MDDRQRARLAFHGLVIFVLGLIIGIPFSMLFTKSDDQHTHLWGVAHLEALVHGLLLMGLGAIGQLVVLPRTHERAAVTLLITGAYSSITGATIGAIWDVLGVKPGESVANTVAWAFLGYGTVAVSVAIVWILWGARRGYRVEDDAGQEATKVLALPQFGAGPRHDAVVETTTWANWSGTQTATPACIEHPQSLEELSAAVCRAHAGGFRVKAVGGGYSWGAGAVTDGALIDVSNLNRLIEVTPAAAGLPATITVEAGTTVHALTAHAADHGLTFATTTVIPWVQVGGAIANGTHGTGREVATVPDTVTAMDVVGPDGAVTHYARDDSDTWRALLVNLGALGIIYSLTFECLPTYAVHAVDTTMPMTDAVDRLEQLYADNECMELFWFPFNEHALVKTWNRTDRPLDRALPRRAWDDLVQALEGALAHPLRRAIEVDPALTPSLCRLMFSMMEKVDVVCPVSWAMQYQTTFAPVVDTSWAIPIDDGLAAVKAAWAAGVDQVEAWSEKGLYPQNMVLHARFVGRPSAGLLSPTTGHDRGSCLIEALTFEGTAHLDDYFAELGRAWKALGGRPHWGKLIYDPGDMPGLYGDNMARFLAVRRELDPEGLFGSAFLDSVLGG